MKVVLQVFNTSQFLEGLNHTFVTLIPKKNQVVKVFDIRSISLCNVLYKIVLKVIENRLKVFLILSLNHKVLFYRKDK